MNEITQVDKQTPPLGPPWPSILYLLPKLKCNLSEKSPDHFWPVPMMKSYESSYTIVVINLRGGSMQWNQQQRRSNYKFIPCTLSQYPNKYQRSVLCARSPSWKNELTETIPASEELGQGFSTILVDANLGQSLPQLRGGRHEIIAKDFLRVRMNKKKPKNSSCRRSSKK